MSTSNLVKFFFLNPSVKPKNADTASKLCSLAYQTATEHQIYPRQILIRGSGHDTTTIGGVPNSKDPMGNHFTFCYKDEKQVQTGMHVACHGYTSGPGDYTLKDSTIAEPKADSTLKKRNNMPVWPSADQLVEGPTIAYSHLGVPESIEEPAPKKT